ncbi:VOC family protein [Candidatus Pacearchaeota archaeon]|nr:VOC family protein [Candidatus Pacearchaeota archaeon]
MQKIVTHLWYDKEAKEAAQFYTSLIPNSKINSIRTIHDTPTGDCDIVSFELAGQPFMAISAGPFFKFNPSISFHIKCKTTDEVDAIWAKLSKDGKVLMDLGKYPFSERYGWVQDKYGLSWQIIFAGNDPIHQKIVPVLMFTGKMAGKTEEAVNLYTSIFPNAKVNFISRYDKDTGADKKGTVKYAHFTMEGMEFGAMDSAHGHNFTFNEAISFIVNCKDQKEIDYYWGKLSADPKSEQCGWLKDKYGVSWQIVPTAMNEMMVKGSKDQVARVTQAFLKMKKFDIDKLKKAYEGK